MRFAGVVAWRRLAVVGALAALLALAPAAGASAAADYVDPTLLELAQRDPTRRVRVIVQGVTTRELDRAVRRLGSEKTRLDVIDALSVELEAAAVAELARLPGLTITPDALLVLDGKDEDKGERARKRLRHRDRDDDRRERRGDRRDDKDGEGDGFGGPSFSSDQAWPYESGVASLWGHGGVPTIAIVDSGIDAHRADFAGRVLAEVDLATLRPNSSGDGRGHGTFVAGIAAGSAPRYTGAAPSARLVSIDVMNDHGIARTSDVIAAAQWIIDNRARYDIRVANFSLHSARPSNFTRDPLNRAVERLWLAGVVVVAPSGNYGKADRPSGVVSPPGNDPFVLTVGATGRLQTDGVAPWSAYGYTHDGFAKPELVAPGRQMVGPIPPRSTLALEHPERLLGNRYMRLSGTSFAAPVVAGTAANLLALHPSWTPDAVKGALMVSARPIPGAGLRDGGGRLDAGAAAQVTRPPNPNLALRRFLVPDPMGGSIPVFDAASWESTARADASWDSVSWTDASWDSASWPLASWSDASWDSVSWTDVSWSDVSWDSVSWSELLVD